MKYEFITLKEIDNFFDQPQHHQHIYLKEQKPVLQYINFEMVFLTKFSLSLSLITTLWLTRKETCISKLARLSNTNVTICKFELRLPSHFTLAIATLLAFETLSASCFFFQICRRVVILVKCFKFATFCFHVHQCLRILLNQIIL